jgi:hypothetical protein
MKGKEKNEMYNVITVKLNLFRQVVFEWNDKQVFKTQPFFSSLDLS